MNRSEVFVETKVPGCGNPLENTTRNPFTCYKTTKANLESDLTKLNLKWVDLVLLHFPPFPSFGACCPAAIVATRVHARLATSGL